MTTAGYKDHDKVSSIRYEQPKLGKRNAIEFDIQPLWTPKVDADSPAYTSMFQPFNLSQYLYPRPPIDLGLWNDWKTMNGGCINVLRMPIKFPGTSYKIPTQLSIWEGFVRRIAGYEAFINPEHDKTFAHITVDFSMVKAGTFHRYPGFHGDGIQGTKLTPKVKVEHSYILTSSPPTEFCIQPFFLKHLDESKHNYFLEFDRQAKETNIFRSLSDHLYLIDPYMVHRTPKIEIDTLRLFVRVTYAFTELQHPKNTINPLFTGQKYNKRVDIRENLMANEFEVPWHLYGLSK